MRVDWIRKSLSSFVVLNFAAFALIDAPSHGQCEQLRAHADAPDDNDWFGNTVAISGDWAAAGFYTDASNGVRSGAVLMYRRDARNGQWAFAQRIVPADNQAGDGFGTRVAMDGSHLVVSARWDDDAANDAGSAYIFRFDVERDEWVLDDEIIASNATASADFGSCIDVRGDLIVVGATGTFGNDANHAYVFQRQPDGDWQEQAILESASADPTRFGFAVATNGTTVFVSGYHSFDYSGTNHWVDVFKASESTRDWSHVQRIEEPPGDDDSGFGTSLDADEQTLIVGSGRSDRELPALQACADVFEQNEVDGGWDHRTVLIAGSLGIPGIWQVKWLAIRNNTIVLGLPFPSGGEPRGVRFQRDDRVPSGWKPVPNIEPSRVSRTTRFAFSVALSDSHVILGGPELTNSSSSFVSSAPGSIFIVASSGFDCNFNGLCDDLDIASGSSSDANANGLPDECECFADTNDDGSVNVTDLLALISGWGACPLPPAMCAGDVAPPPSGDGLINVTDLLLVISNWGACP